MEQIQQMKAAAQTLADLLPGEHAEIISVSGTITLRNRLWELGFRHGERVEMVRQAPLADPLEFRINGGHISLRRFDAMSIVVRKLN